MPARAWIYLGSACTITAAIAQAVTLASGRHQVSATLSGAIALLGAGAGTRLLLMRSKACRLLGGAIALACMVLLAGAAGRLWS